jgi:hypothetical protein
MAAISQYVAKGTHAGQKVIVKAKSLCGFRWGRGSCKVIQTLT